MKGTRPVTVNEIFGAFHSFMVYSITHLRLFPLSTIFALYQFLQRWLSLHACSISRGGFEKCKDSARRLFKASQKSVLGIEMA